MHCLFSFSILVEPDIQRLSGFLLEALRCLDAPAFGAAARIPALNQHLREAVAHSDEALRLSLVFEKGCLQVRWEKESFPLAMGLRQPAPTVLAAMTQDFEDRIHASHPELLRLQNVAIRQQLDRARKEARREIHRIEHQLIHRKKELDLYIQKAETDSLTGLLNRGAYDRLLHEILREHSRAPSPFSLIFLDLDYFKEVNDTFGHAYGDEVLRSMALAMRAAIREGQDRACRIGGDEFAILLSADLRQAERISHVILSDMDSKVSIGIAPWKPGDTPESLARRADQALYQAKENGRGRISLAPHPQEEAEPRLPLCL